MTPRSYRWGVVVTMLAVLLTGSYACKVLTVVDTGGAVSGIDLMLLGTYALQALLGMIFLLRVKVRGEEEGR